MTTTKKPWKAPTLTHYGKLSELTQAGSVLRFTQDITGDGTADEFWSTGTIITSRINVVVVPQANSSDKIQFPVRNLGVAPTGIRYDSNGDGNADFVVPITNATQANDVNSSVWDTRDGVKNSGV